MPQHGVGPFPDSTYVCRRSTLAPQTAHTAQLGTCGASWPLGRVGVEGDRESTPSGRRSSCHPVPND
jgi:hypothetical protein